MTTAEHIGKRVGLSSEAIIDFCRRNHIRKLAFFGSVLREDFRPDSDIDVLVELDGTRPVGFLTFAGMELELSELIGRKVDLKTPASLSRYFRDEVVRQAHVAYAQG